jgi:glycosyltransferase involved in cell wall biosynthesis
MQAWCRSLIALAPSIWPEPFGIVVLEAMSAGRPVIATRMGGLTDIVVDGQTGLLVPPHDPAALEQAMRMLLENPELRQQMGRAGKIRLKQFSASQVVPRIEATYRRLLGCDNPAFLEGGNAEVNESPLAKISGGDRGVPTR